MKELRAQSKQLKPVLQIGKNGITEGTIELIERELEQKKLIKIKILKTALEGLDKKEAAQSIAQKTGAQIVDQVGHMVVLYKK